MVIRPDLQRSTRSRPADSGSSDAKRRNILLYAQLPNVIAIT